MLYLVGLGLQSDLTREGFTTAKKCKVYLEMYTSFLTVPVQDLEKILEKHVTVLTREDIEETQEFLKEAQTSDIALLVVGDPLVATTHSEIIIEARKRNIKTKIIHNSSIYSGIAETGLQIYKFGKTVTIPFPQKGFQPTSFYDILQNNKKMGAHTLVLLDIQEDKNKYMNPKEAMKILQDLGFQEELICVSRLGSHDQNIVYGDIEDLLLLDESYWGLPPHCLVVPSTLHFKEEEYLEAFRLEVVP
ncbi:MAG: diphthine synthase [Theionarchaea archaeon]|nr:diphthine synthase [Theionarchaea archaeon]